MKQEKIIWLTIIAGLLAALAAWYFLVFKKNGEGDGEGDGNTPYTGCNDDFPIKMGSCGSRVRKLQKYFNEKRAALSNPSMMLEELVVDGKFGPNTLNQAYRWIRAGGNATWSQANKQYIATTGISQNEYEYHEQYF